MPATLNFPTFVDDEILFANKEAANTFFQGLQINDATPTTFGVVKKAQFPAALAGAIVPVYNTINVYDDNGSIAASYEIVSRVSLEEMITKLNDIQNLLNSMRSAMIDAKQAIEAT